MSCVVSHFAFVLLAACLRANNMRAGKGRARERGQVFGWEHFCISFNLVQFWSELRRELKEFAPCSCLAPIARGWDWQKKQGWRERKIPSVATCFSVYFADQPPTASVLRNKAGAKMADQNLMNLEIPFGHANLREVPYLLYSCCSTI